MTSVRPVITGAGAQVSSALSGRASVVTDPQVGARRTLTVVSTSTAPVVPNLPTELRARYVHEQLEPATVWTVHHNLAQGMVIVEVFSLDYSIIWDNVMVQFLDDDTVRLGFDDPTAGLALVL